MAEHSEGRTLRVTLRQVQILDRKEPFYDRFGEVRLHARVSTKDHGGTTQVTELPEKGVYRVSDLPGHNLVDVNVPIFRGLVSGHLEVELTAVELDLISEDDPFKPYRRVHTGSTQDLIGHFGPGDEGVDPEDVGDWRVWYDIEEL